MDEEEGVLGFTEARGLFTLGWVSLPLLLSLSLVVARRRVFFFLSHRIATFPDFAAACRARGEWVNAGAPGLWAANAGRDLRGRLQARMACACGCVEAGTSAGTNIPGYLALRTAGGVSPARAGVSAYERPAGTELRRKTGDSRRRMASTDNERDSLRPPLARAPGGANTSARAELVSLLVLRLRLIGAR
ncbi:hypothetical protein DFH09DRAFT_1327890 [Mycena vulgaris]|nr:hypothetical protein DFH09DRAFT_1327890 [Mycena vulgaris]